MRKDQTEQLISLVLKNESSRAKEVFNHKMALNVAAKLNDVRKDVVAKMFAK